MRQEYYILDRAFNMNDKLLHLQYMIIHLNQQLSLRQKGVKFLIVKNKKTNKQRKEKQNKNKKTKTKRKKHYFFFTSPSQTFLDQKRLAGEDAIFVLLH